MRRALLVLPLMLQMLGTASPAEAATATCLGVKATIVSSASVINGTSKRDVIVVIGKKSHTVNSGAGNDLICGSSGSDKITAGRGNDVIVSNAGSDTVFAGPGEDRVVAGPGADVVMGGSGIDTLSGGAGVDAIDGGAGADLITPGGSVNYCIMDLSDSMTGECLEDTTTPTITVEPNTLERVAGSRISFMWSVSDESRISQTWATIGGANGWVTEWCGFAIEGQLISGTDKSGTYSVPCELPSTAVNGTYTLFISALDVFGKRSEIQQDFLVTGGVSDNRAPELVSISAPVSVFGLESFTITYTARDESGVANAYIYLMANGSGFANSQGMSYLTYEAPVLVSSNGDESTFTQRMNFNNFAPAGTYSVWVGLRDIYGNRDFFTAQPTVELVLQNP